MRMVRVCVCVSVCVCVCVFVCVRVCDVAARRVYSNVSTRLPRNAVFSPMMWGSPGGSTGPSFSLASGEDDRASDARGLTHQRPEALGAVTSPSRSRPIPAVAMLSPIRGASKIAPIAPTPIALAANDFSDRRDASLNEYKDFASPAQLGVDVDSHGHGTPSKADSGDVAIGDASLSRYLTAPHPPAYGVLSHAWQQSALFGAGLEKAAWLSVAPSHSSMKDSAKTIAWTEFADSAITGARARTLLVFASSSVPSVGVWADACQSIARDEDKGGKMMRSVAWTSVAVNRSERAVAVALLKHSGLAEQAIASYETWVENLRAGSNTDDRAVLASCLSRAVLGAFVTARKVRRWMSTTRAELQADTRVYEKLAPGIEHRSEHAMRV